MLIYLVGCSNQMSHSPMQEKSELCTYASNAEIPSVATHQRPLATRLAAIDDPVEVVIRAEKTTPPDPNPNLQAVAQRIRRNLCRAEEMIRQLEEVGAKVYSVDLGKLEQNFHSKHSVQDLSPPRKSKAEIMGIVKHAGFKYIQKGDLSMESLVTTMDQIRSEEPSFACIVDLEDIKTALVEPMEQLSYFSKLKLFTVLAKSRQSLTERFQRFRENCPGCHKCGVKRSVRREVKLNKKLNL